MIIISSISAGVGAVILLTVIITVVCIRRRRRKDNARTRGSYGGQMTPPNTRPPEPHSHHTLHVSQLQPPPLPLHPRPDLVTATSSSSSSMTLEVMSEGRDTNRPTSAHSYLHLINDNSDEVESILQRF